MNWERRLREMVLAGGALAAGACSGGGATNAADAGVPSSPHESGASDDASEGIGSGGVCCNADPDPCCTCTGEITEAAVDSPCGRELACQAAGGTWEPYIVAGQPGGGVILPHCEFEASDDDADSETPDGGPTDAPPVDSEASSASSLQCGGGTISGAGTDQCINAGGVCVQLPDPACCDLVPGFDPTNSGCPHAPFAIRCCALDGGAGKDATDAGAE